MTNYQWPEHLYINDGEAMGGEWLHTKEQLEFAVEDLNQCNDFGEDILTFEKAIYQKYDFEHTDKADPNTAYYSAWICYTADGRTIKKLSVLKVVGDGKGIWEEDKKDPNGSYYSCVDDDEDDENVVEILKSYSKLTKDNQ